ncbi:ferric reductase-like transmembrane domain-containing protein [Paenibacillus sp. sptzw28]|uniref:ferric reductase-like transmembrane domain-containing protein n=1 Tax=Paenibacillus sp. sptzw28 TaxID=715179 RepID=UPI001C6F46B2|nr:ferric reductase-like transmembrane domain-containing protein [Paenibacillus sp. sptzw28]QYR21280.1 ferric reductase-like transmembrane domain-containing protein [Paenibacillus sp. sptzw28]
MNGFLDALSVWSTTRAAGITAYVFLFLSTAAGIIMSLKMLNGRAKSVLLTVHQSSGWFGFLFGILHGSVLLFDKYVGYSLGELLFPFTSHSHPVLTGLGTLSFYIALILIISSDMMKHLGKKVWRTIHFLAFPGYFMGLIHGFFIGTDTQYPWVKTMYFATAGAVLVLTLFRIAAVKFERRSKPAVNLKPDTSSN